MTATAPAALAVASGAPVVPVRIERQADGRHKAFIEAEIPFAEPRSRADIVPITKKINEIVGRWIAACPEQYMWLHRRFMINNDYTGLSRNQ
jgi:KDO2-lipid IV(A) lauroyltransferase